MLMFGALVYLQYHSIKNRTLARVKRLRQPKYLLGGIVGALYFYFYFFRYLFTDVRSRGAVPFASGSADLEFLLLIGGLILFVVLLLAWVLPNSRAALVFTEAEIAFLFPAPISRRGLIHYKLLRSQFAILFTVLLLTLITNRFGGRAWIHAAGWWLILSTINLHMLGASFVRTMLLDRGISNWTRRIGVLLAVLAFATVVLLWARSRLGGLDAALMESPEALKEHVRELLTTGPAFAALLPFRLVVAPYLSPDALSFFKALPFALLIVGLHYFWVILSNVAFEEASLEASRKVSQAIANAKSGNWNAGRKQGKARRAPFRLAPYGPPFVALFWKNLIASGSAFSARTWIILMAAGIGVSVGLTSTRGMESSPMFFGIMSGAFLAWSLLLGPQVLRHDFRHDLALADLMKQYPLAGWQIALGQIMAPVVILTCIQWFLLTVAAVFLSRVGQLGAFLPLVFPIALSCALLCPLLNLVSFFVPNAAVLLFPAWVLPGKDGGQGIEATGQRLIAMLAQLLAFLATLVPAAAVFAAALVIGRLILPLSVAIPVASVAAGFALALEAGVTTYLLGVMFEKFNVSEELSS